MARRLAVLALAAGTLALAGCAEDSPPPPEDVAEAICAAAELGYSDREKADFFEGVPRESFEDALDIAVEECPDALLDNAGY